VGQGRENSKIFLKDNPNVAVEIEAKIRDYYKEHEQELVEEVDKAESPAEETETLTE
jgi:recombination protein RecA